MVIICNVIGCFMLALFHLENLMDDVQYKVLFSIRVRGGTPDPQCFSVHLLFSIFSGVELKLCFLLENVNILLK